MTTPDGNQPRLVLPRTALDPDGEAVWTASGSLTWSELEERARRFALGLRSEGLEAGDSWALLSRNRIEWAEISIGNGRAGTRYVPLNWHLTSHELADLLRDSGAKLLIAAPDLAATAEEAAAQAGLSELMILGEEYQNWLRDQSDEPLPDCPLGAPLQYTGGTTGRSKGVMRSDQDGLASELGERYAAWGELVGMPENDHAMLCTPAYHALGGAMLRTALARGNDVAVLDHWDPEETLSVIEQRRVGATCMVPTQFIRLLKLDPEIRSRFDLSSLRWVLHTAAPCPAWVKREMIDWFGPVVVELYGSSEGTGPVIATSEEWLERPGTVGRATRALELFVLDDDGNDLPPGEVGTIYVRRRDGAPVYLNDEAKTASMMLADGRFTVGDVGWLDEDGYLFLADRRVDLIISGGTNVYPAEIEAVLVQHPSVADVAVFGIPHAEWGQEIKAVVESADGIAVDPAELLVFAREQLAAFKLPRSIDVVDALPREASGKLKKHLLRAPYWDDVEPAS